MGLHFGNLAKVRGIIYYKLSPYEQKTFAGYFSKGFPNTVRRFASKALIVVPRMFATLIIKCTYIDRFI